MRQVMSLSVLVVILAAAACSRPAPYNVVADLAKVSAAIKAEGVRNVGFTWQFAGLAYNNRVQPTPPTVVALLP